MQNIDFYEGKNIYFSPNPASGIPPREFIYNYQQFDNTPSKTKSRNASRIIFMITALCIVSFTAGLVLGIKFAGGTEREIIDKSTFNIMSDAGSKVSSMLSSKINGIPSAKAMFPKHEYPFAIKINPVEGNENIQKIASYLNHNGHTVILAKNKDFYQIYLGPYKDFREAQAQLKNIASLEKYSLAKTSRIIKR
jgi:preprotein translocase subunit SecF